MEETSASEISTLRKEFKNVGEYRGVSSKRFDTILQKLQLEQRSLETFLLKLQFNDFMTKMCLINMIKMMKH